MNKKKIFLWLAIAFTLLLVLASVLYQYLLGKNKSDNLASSGSDGTNTENTQQTDQILAPNFVVFDANGRRVSLSDFRGKPTVVNFWASWCGPCRMEMPEFEAIYQRMGDSIHFLMVNMTDGSSETFEKASSFIADSGYTFPVYYDTEFSAAITYGVTSLPATYFIDADGYAVAQATGAIDEATLLRGIDMVKP